jgi:hypothetical protein
VIPGDDELELRQRAANAYLVWPLAALELVRERPGATAWSRLHTRQAFVYGIVASVGYLALLALPLLLIVIVPPLAASTTAVVVLYAIGLLADIVGAFVLFGLAMTFRERALRGEVFAIRIVTPVTDRVFRLDR